LAPLGIKKENVMTFDLLDNGILTLEELIEFDDVDVDLSLLTRPADELNVAEKKRQTILLKVKAFCDSFEERLASKGGIGFFLGGIGPDGHIAFNQEGADHSSTTRLVNFNYPTAAAAAGDLGGIEVARGKAAMTIGLRTITANPAATQIIMAAGEGKATVVREALEEPADHKRPASVLHGLPGARFYITQGAAIELTARRADKFAKLDDSLISWAANYSSQSWSPSLNLVQPPEEYQMLEGLLYEASIKSKVPVRALTLSHLELFPRVYAALHACFKTPEALATLTGCAARRLEEKISWGVQSSVPRDQRIIHTAPHHDDIMLSYHPAMHEMLGRAEKHEDPNNQLLGEQQYDNKNYFAYLTSGFHSVNDAFLTKQVDAVRGLSGNYEPLRKMVVDGTVAKDYDALMADFRIAFFAQDSEAQDYIENIIFLRKIVEVWKLDAAAENIENLIAEVTGIVESIRSGYLATHHPGDSVPKEMQLLKGCMRESEVDRVWAVSRMPMDRVYHMRSKFYNDDFFTPMPSLEDDAVPMADLYQKHQPGILTVAFDPEGTGPDTHYKVLLVVAAGLRVAISRSKLLIF
jgi:glucosamine-6-phosphate deaminase